MLKDKFIVMGFSGSIACYKACDVLQVLRKEGARLRCLMSKGAEAFITPLTLESLSGEAALGEQFQRGVFRAPLHTKLADDADLVLLCPASANLIARLACGFAGDLMTSVVLATRAPVVVVPAMNDNMFQHAATQENLAQVKKLGYHVVAPVKGHLVCGREGVGHIASCEEIVKAVKNVLH